MHCILQRCVYIMRNFKFTPLTDLTATDVQEMRDTFSRIVTISTWKTDSHGYIQGNPQINDEHDYR